MSINMSMKMQCVGLFLLLLMAFPVLAVIEVYEFSSPELEQRYHQLGFELRCPKCQNQNIADSNAPIAQDLRRLLHQQLEAGASDDEILLFMVARYGEFVLYKPRYGGVTATLWLAPLVMLLAGVLFLFRLIRGRQRAGESGEVTLSEADQTQLKNLLDRAENDS